MSSLKVSVDKDSHNFIEDLVLDTGAESLKFCYDEDIGCFVIKVKCGDKVKIYKIEDGEIEKL
jgi:hypothetical protein